MEQSIFFYYTSVITIETLHNAVRLRLFLLGKLDILGRIDIEELENIGKERKKKKG